MAQTDAMRQAAMQRGITPAEFDNVNQTYADLKTKRAALEEKLAQSKERPCKFRRVWATGREERLDP